MYDRFYEGTEPSLDPPGLFDYSKGRFSAITATVETVAWDGDELVVSAYTAGEYRKVLLAMSGFSNAGAGKLIGPDGQEMDNESFLSDLTITSQNDNFSGLTTGPLLFRVVTQKYGKGIVQYGNQVTTNFYYDPKGNGGSYDNLCDANGVIYLEVDLQVPCSIGANSLDGYSGYTLSLIHI